MAQPLGNAKRALPWDHLPRIVRVGSETGARYAGVRYMEAFMRRKCKRGHRVHLEEIEEKELDVLLSGPVMATTCYGHDLI